MAATRRRRGSSPADRVSAGIDAAQAALKDLRRDLGRRGGGDLLGEIEKQLRDAAKNARGLGDRVAKQLAEITPGASSGRSGSRKSTSGRKSTKKRATSAKKRSSSGTKRAVSSAKRGAKKTKGAAKGARSGAKRGAGGTKKRSGAKKRR